jgi:hypothetical protein
MSSWRRTPNFPPPPLPTITYLTPAKHHGNMFVLSYTAPKTHMRIICLRIIPTCRLCPACAPIMLSHLPSTPRLRVCSLDGRKTFLLPSSGGKCNDLTLTLCTPSNLRLSPSPSAAAKISPDDISPSIHTHMAPCRCTLNTGPPRIVYPRLDIMSPDENANGGTSMTTLINGSFDKPATGVGK